MSKYSQTALEITNVNKTYGDNLKALKNINLTIKAGDFFGLLGPNGAGKSTLINTINTLVSKDTGQIKLFGQELKARSPYLSWLGVVPQEMNLGSFDKVKNIVISQAGYYGVSRKQAEKNTDFCLKQLKLWDKRDKKVMQLSGGMKRRLMIARALAHKPRLLILDEPTTGIDVELRHETWQFLRDINAAGTTIILTSHYLEEIEKLCPRVAILNHGEIIKETSMGELLTTLPQQTYLCEWQSSADPALIKHPDIKITPHSATQWEISLFNKSQLSDFLELASQHKIRIHSLKPKTNPLEEIFLQLIQGEK